MTSRYERQIPLIGKDGQEKLLNSRVLVVGAGGLGSAVVSYLAAAGIGRLGIVDGDVVEDSNLQRQTIHAGKIGENKAESAAEFVENLNTDVVVDIYPYDLTEKNAERIAKNYDVLVGCPDNFETRYIINSVAVKLGKPFVHAAVHGWEGEVGVFVKKPCYRCYIAKGVEIGGEIIGAVAGVFGCIQALEVIKIITGKGEPLIGKIFRLDLKTFENFILELKERENCETCGGKNEIR
ncbi:MAG: HesA/MoeB/ThiF family protein [Archaeoglobaceae archaeon]|nr:HesA/MoeB/ThiF family protein [Archaeoglobaceae archaeon]MCX8152394.1 HesA/MoeB/ThiF family protein [Archaeoglobaceae archaeon]MDW8013734.1 HesA/MoeB/ThiF family protein [Archaeoglobaceae archaeon]